MLNIFKDNHSIVNMGLLKIYVVNGPQFRSSLVECPWKAMKPLSADCAIKKDSRII